MTKEEKLEILAEAEVRAYETVKAMDGPSMVSENFVHLLHAVDQLRWMQEVTANPEQFDDPVPVAPKVELDPIEEPKPIPTEEPGLTKADMVSRLTKFQTNGVAVNKVMESMGYAKLSQVPAERYWELLELCQKDADGEG